MLANSSTFTFYPAIATTTSYTFQWVTYCRTRAEARAQVKVLADRSSTPPRLVRIVGLDGKPHWQVRWMPKTMTYNVAA